VRILGIDVPDDLVERWRSYLAPEWQPFFVDAGGEVPDSHPQLTLTDDLRDTYKVWRVRGPKTMVWFDEPSFMALTRSERAQLVRSQVERKRGAVPTVKRWANQLDAVTLRAQADGHRFVWWRSLVDQAPVDVLTDFVRDGQPVSRHREVSGKTWRAGERALPRAREIAGKFALPSGPNCFGTTLAAAGLAEPTDCVVQEPFEEFLATRCTPGGRDDDIGTVLVWRDKDGLPVHSAVTIGDGWALEKPAQTWWTPRVVLEVRQLIKANRWPGQRLERHHIVTSAGTSPHHGTATRSR
jgi:hypothetical protein